ncbi:MAG: hypothetical protein ACTSWX_02630 [Promethearchaeota archaeon]
MATEIKENPQQNNQKFASLSQFQKLNNFVAKSVEKNPDFCSNHVFFTDFISGDTICKKCGLVIDSHLPISQNFTDWYQNKKKYSRNPQKSQNFSPDLQRALKRGSDLSWKEKRERIGINEINRIAALHNFGNSIRERAIDLFQRLIKLDEFKNHYLKLVALISFYHIIKTDNNPLSLVEIIQDSNYTLRLANSYYLIVRKTLKIRVFSEETNNPNIYLPKICSLLKVNQDTNELARKIISKFKESINISGFKLKGIAGAGIYIACRLNHIPKSQKEVAKAAKITSSTLRTRIKEMEQFLRRNRTIWEE